MKSAKLLNVLVAGVLLATLAAGCKKQPKNITSIPANQVRMGNGQMSPGNFPATGLTQDRGPGGLDLAASELPSAMEGGVPDRSALAAQTVYFDYDRSAIQPSEQGKLDEVAAYLKNTAGVQLLVEGHCDERGTAEYNRSLGERRAISAREYLLQRHGISSERVTTVSFGEDQPATLEKTEEAYAKNRRAEFVILRPQ